jgi:DNA polymerase-4
MSRTIIHVDLDAFFCAIEEQRDPSLRGKAFAVGGQPENRGVVASCSYAARRLGVRSAMATGRARLLCPHLIIVPVRHDAYREASGRVMNLLRSVTRQIEQLSIDEAFLDVSELVDPENPDSARQMAQHLQWRIWHELKLSCSLGVASNKLVAKIANDYGKATSTKRHSPQAICVVPAGEESTFLAPLPANALWGVGPKTEVALAKLGLNTIGDIAQWPQVELIRRFGQHGYDLSRHAQGIDKRPVVTQRETKSVSSETTFTNDVRDWDELNSTLEELVEDVIRRLGRKKLQGTTVKLKLRWSDFSTPTRQLTLPAPTQDSKVLWEASQQLLKQLWEEGRAVRLMGVGLSGLSRRTQLCLWDENAAAEPDNNVLTPAKERRLQRAFAELKERFGEPMVQRGLPVKDENALQVLGE